MVAFVRAAERDLWLYIVVLFCIVYYIPTFRYIGALADEGVMLHGAARILEGQILYRDFFEFQGPGAFFITAGWMKLFGSAFASVRVLGTATATLIALLIYLALRRVSGNRAIAVAVTLVFVVRAPHDISHHSFTTAASMAAALAVLIAVSGARFVVPACLAAGVFAGLAAITTQGRGAVLAVGMIAVLLSFPERAKRVAWTVTGMTVAPAASFVYLVTVGAAREAIDAALIFPLQRYSGIAVVPFGALASLADACIVLFIPLALLSMLAIDRDRWRTPHVRVSLVLAFIAFITAYPRPDAPHLTHVMPLATPIFALGVTDLLKRINGSGYSVPVRAVLVGVCVWHIGYSVAGRALAVSLPRHQIETARGIVERHSDDWTREFEWLIVGIQRHSAAGDPFFFYPNMALVPYLTARRQVAQLDMMIPGFTTPAQFRDVCTRVVANAQYVVIDRPWTHPANILSVHPATVDPNPPEKRAFEAALMEGFELIAHSPRFEVRRRTTRAIASLCGRIDVADSQVKGASSSFLCRRNSPTENVQTKARACES